MRETRDLQHGVDCVGRGKRFPTRVEPLKSVLIQPRKGAPKFFGNAGVRIGSARGYEPRIELYRQLIVMQCTELNQSSRILREGRSRAVSLFFLFNFSNHFAVIS